MIATNGHTYRYLTDKFYMGGKQIGKVYHGDTLVYPETLKENEIPTEGGKAFELEGKLLNGNIYDTGFAPSVNTCVEICFANNSKASKMGDGEFGGFAIFGTHQDVYYATSQHNTGSNGKYNSEGDGGDWGKGLSYNGWQAWKTKTAYHFILKQKEILFRFGGEAVQDSATSINAKCSFSLDSNNKHYYTAVTDTDITVSDENGDYYWNKETQVENLKGKYFTITADYDHWQLASGIGKMYTGNDDYLENKFWYQFKTDISSSLDSLEGVSGTAVEGKVTSTHKNSGSPSTNKIKHRALYSLKKENGEYIKGGNLWIGTHNRNFSSTEDAVDPNKIRNHIDYNQYKTNPPESITFDTDIKSNRFTTGDLEWVYVLIQDKNLEDGTVLKDSNGKYIKYLYIPKKTTIADKNNPNDYYIAFEKYETSDGVTWNEEPSEIIFPFMYLKPKETTTTTTTT